MRKITVQLYQRTFVKDPYGGAKEVLNYKQDITGYLVPSTQTFEEEDGRISINTEFKFLSDDRVSGRNLAVKYEGVYYEVAIVKNLYNKGALMGLKSHE